jgi:hypothetical protein
MIRFVALALGAIVAAQAPHSLERQPFVPRHVVCYRAAAAPVIDGRLDDPAWQSAAFSDPFVDIEGDARPVPRLRTQVKMLWDSEFLYIGADMEEPHLWGALTKRDSVIFHENDFEIFLDPDGDTHDYYELEINALNTVWDLMLTRPYRDGGRAIDAWDIAGLQTAVHLRGTLNDPRDTDHGWSVEIAMPWSVLEEAAPRDGAPKPGDQWRLNFSRVEWPLEVRDGKYLKRTDAKGQLVPENNWVWSPQGAVAMHMPERWGYVQFSDVQAGQDVEGFQPGPVEGVKWALRRLYYRQADFRKAHGRYARTLTELKATDVPIDGVQLHATDELYVLSRLTIAGTVYLRQDGKVWVSRRNKP